MRGSVNLNCCSTLRTSVPHSRQRKHPVKSSGRTSLVRVTVPAGPLLGLKSRTAGRLSMLSQVHTGIPMTWLLPHSRQWEWIALPPLLDRRRLKPCSRRSC